MIRRTALLTFLPLLALAQTPAQVRQYLDAWDVPRAVPAARRLVASFEDTSSVSKAEALDLLGEALSLADDPAALSTLEAAFGLKVDLLPPGDISLARTLLCIATERSQRREWMAALEEYKKALGIIDGRPGPVGDSLRPQALLGIGSAATNLGRYAEAKAALEQSLAQSGSPQNALRALSTLAYLQTDLPLAEQYLARCKALATTDPLDQTQTLLLSAGLAMERGRYDEAVAGLRQVLSLFEERLGAQNRRLLPILRNIARGERFQGQFQSVLRTGERALSISVRSFGELSSPTAELLGILATAQAESGRLAEARQLYDRAIGAQTKLYGPTATQVGVELFSLANLEQVMGDFESSLRHAGQALQIREALDGKESPRTVTIYALLGRVNALNGNVNKGRALTELAVAIGRRTVGDAHPRTIFARSDLGEVLYLAKEYAGALPHFAAAVAGQAKLFGAGSIRTAQGGVQPRTRRTSPWTSRRSAAPFWQRGPDLAGGFRAGLSFPGRHECGPSRFVTCARASVGSPGSGAGSGASPPRVAGCGDDDGCRARGAFVRSRRSRRAAAGHRPGGFCQARAFDSDPGGDPSLGRRHS